MDESGFITAFGGTESLDFLGTTPDTTTSSPTPSSHSDFNTQAAPGDVKGVLGGVASVISAAGNAVIGYQTASNQATVNSAIQQAAAAQSLQTIATQGKLAQIENATRLAQAQANYNKAAGVAGSSGGLVTIVAIAGLILAAMQLSPEGKK